MSGICEQDSRATLIKGVEGIDVVADKILYAVFRGLFVSENDNLVKLLSIDKEFL